MGEPGVILRRAVPEAAWFVFTWGLVVAAVRFVASEVRLGHLLKLLKGHVHPASFLRSETTHASLANSIDRFSLRARRRDG